MNKPAAAQAIHRQGEVHRLQGDFAAAEQAYRDASHAGREPQPGLALLRLAQGDGAAAAAAIRRSLGETVERPKRVGLLPAYIEIMLAVGDLEQARVACDELEEASTGYESDMLGAMVAYARGAFELAGGDAQAALVALRRAAQVWQELEAPYEAAARACSSDSRAARWGTTTRPRWSWRPPGAPSPSSERRRTRARRLARRSGGHRRHSRTDGARSCRCCVWWPPAERTRRSPPSWS